MLSYNQDPVSEVSLPNKKKIFSFIKGNESNVDIKTINSFGDEWTKFHSFNEAEIKVAGDQYFDIVSDSMLNKDTVVLDLGCGTGRWTKYIADKAKFIECIDPSNAVYSAAVLLEGKDNTRITQASSDNIPFSDNSFDFIMSLGVLHHIPDTELALKQAVQKLKINGYFLLYLYYAFDNRSVFYKFLFHCTSIFRFIICRLPSTYKKFICDLIAIVIYIPIISISKLLLWLFPNNSFYLKLPLSYYIDKSFNIIKNDALDRFGTPLEQRFTKIQIQKMMQNTGLSIIQFSNNMPCWHVVGQKIKSN